MLWWKIALIFTAKCFTEFRNFKLAALFAYKSLITTSSFDSFTSSEGNLLQYKYKVLSLVSFYWNCMLALSNTFTKQTPPESELYPYILVIPRNKVKTHSNKDRTATRPKLPDPNHSKFHLPSRYGDLKSEKDEVNTSKRNCLPITSLRQNRHFTLLVEVWDSASQG